jgi:hypothetical protein
VEQVEDTRAKHSQYCADIWQTDIKQAEFCLTLKSQANSNGQ